MTDIAIKDQIKTLVELKVIDFEIYKHTKELEEKPVYVEVLKNKYEEKKVHFSELEDLYKKVQLERKEKELDLASKEGEIVKANAQLSQLKTNKEYQAKITEIANINSDKSLIEEKILLSFDKADSVKAEIEKEKEFLAQEEKKYLSEKKNVEDEIKVIRDKVNVLNSKRNQLTPGIDKNVLYRYEKILASREGLAIVPVDGDICGGCFMSVPAQVVNEIKMYKEIIYCETCSRILYLEEDIQ